MKADKPETSLSARWKPIYTTRIYVLMVPPYAKAASINFCYLLLLQLLLLLLLVLQQLLHLVFTLLSYLPLLLLATSLANPYRCCVCHKTPVQED